MTGPIRFMGRTLEPEPRDVWRTSFREPLPWISLGRHPDGRWFAMLHASLFTVHVQDRGTPEEALEAVRLKALELRDQLNTLEFE